LILGEGKTSREDKWVEFFEGGGNTRRYGLRCGLAPANQHAASHLTLLLQNGISEKVKLIILAGDVTKNSPAPSAKKCRKQNSLTVSQEERI
jgi:hypothetical protein